MRFFLGTHQPHWLWGKQVQVPLFVKAIALRRVKKYALATCSWALDSGGYSELTTHGKWTVSPEQYALEVYRFRDEIGGLQWASIQDWMCEDHVRALTGKTIEEHQQLTIDNYDRLLQIAPDLPWVPVLQGQRPHDYLEHLGMYFARGFDLTKNFLVGVGSVCRRQGTEEAHKILRILKTLKIHTHAFGFKTNGLKTSRHLCESADSLAWSFNARRNPPIDTHTHTRIVLTVLSMRCVGALNSSLKLETA